MLQAESVKANVFFLSKQDIYSTEKPYSLTGTATIETTDVLPATNVVQTYESVIIKDLRGIEKDFTYQQSGFAVIDMPSVMSYTDFDSPDKVQRVHQVEIGRMLEQYLQATEVHVFNYRIRRQNSNFPLDYAKPMTRDGQPNGRAHIDISAKSFKGLVELFCEHKKRPVPDRGHWAYVNVWKPLRGPVKSWPLALCDASSIDPQDLREHDIVLAEGSGENVFVHPNHGQRWYYLSQQMPDELLVFRQADTDTSLNCVPHTAFELPCSNSDQSDALPRESIETRAIVYFEG